MKAMLFTTEDSMTSGVKCDAKLSPMITYSPGLSLTWGRKSSLNQRSKHLQ